MRLKEKERERISEDKGDSERKCQEIQQEKVKNHSKRERKRGREIERVMDDDREMTVREKELT